MTQTAEPSFHDQVIAILPKLRVQALALTRNRTAAEDLVQDAVCNALSASGSFIPGTNFPAWMHRILRNRFISNLRKRRDTTDIDDVPAHTFATEAPHEDRLALKELAQAMTKLPSDQREALMMVVVHGMSYEALAEATGCAVARRRAGCSGRGASSRRGCSARRRRSRCRPGPARRSRCCATGRTMRVLPRADGFGSIADGVGGRAVMARRGVFGDGAWHGQERLSMTEGKTPPKAPSGKGKPVADKPAESAFDLWLNRGLHQLFDDVANEPVPEELLKLIQEDRKK